MATGSTVHEIVDAAQRLADAGIQAKVVSVPSIRPCDTAALLAALKPCKAVITVEEHNVNGGLGSLVAEVLAEAGAGIPLKRLGIPDGEYAAAADRGWLRKTPRLRCRFRRRAGAENALILRRRKPITRAVCRAGFVFTSRRA
ncbi:transketolase [Klebsiella michiganensis]|uniref:Transketolase n=1 Tax=Klebsiella michiganensis TaxID=1134687 RepID=A0A7H4LXQ1_9ENTR|nr:transketolase [Klebsiella michiganensis]